MTTLFNFLKTANTPRVLQNQTVIWNGVEYNTPLFSGFETGFGFNTETSTLTISVISFFENSSMERNEYHLGTFVIGLDELSAIYNVSKDKLFALFNEKVILNCAILSDPTKTYDRQWCDSFSQFLTEKHQDWGDEWFFTETQFIFNSPFVKTNIDQIILEFVGSLIEFGCK